MMHIDVFQETLGLIDEHKTDMKEQAYIELCSDIQRRMNETKKNLHETELYQVEWLIISNNESSEHPHSRTFRSSIVQLITDEQRENNKEFYEKLGLTDEDKHTLSWLDRGLITEKQSKHLSAHSCVWNGYKEHTKKGQFFPAASWVILSCCRYKPWAPVPIQEARKRQRQQ